MKHRNNYKYGMDSLIGNKMRYIVAILLMVMSFCGVQAQKVILFDDKDSPNQPSFKDNFEVLTKNRKIYNAYNDSIFLIKDHDLWVSFFRRRALKNHQIFLANKIALNNISDFFKQDTLHANDYLRLFETYVGDFVTKEANDPFLTLEFCNLFEAYNKQAPDSMNLSNFINYFRGQAYGQIVNLGNDTTKWVDAYQCYRSILSEDAKRYFAYKKYFPLALWQLTGNIYLRYKVMSLEEHNRYFLMLKEWYGQHQNDSILSQNIMRDMRNMIATHDENLLRNIYLADTTVMDKQVADSLMRKIVRRNLANKKLSDLSLIRTLIMQVNLGEITASTAVSLSLERYRKVWKNIKNKHLTDVELRNYLMPFDSFFYLNDISDRSFAHKRRLVKRMCADIETAYQHRDDQQRTTLYVRYLNKFVTYKRLTKYLTAKERIHFLNTLNVATQVTTYAHSVHVSMIAEVLMKGVLAYQPELLVGALGDLQVSDILANKKKYIDFAHDAAMYHDLGKNSIISVVNNDYRPLTDEEFAIIKRHPELGLQYLELAPSLKKFHDTTLGHHKWYNGKGGYPMSFDNTKSPKRILIDMVTLSDCMQAATERVGRNYKGEKNFDTVMAEFRRDAGVRYNPDLVALIDAHPDLAKKLADLINEGWVEIYYNIYSQYIK